MTIPLPPVPTTIYAIGTEVESADLNDYQTFMESVRAELESSSHIRETYRWGPINSSVLVVDAAPVSNDLTALIDTNTTVLLVAGSNGNVVTGDPQLELTLQNAAATQRAAIIPTAGGSPPSPADDCPISDIDNVIAVMEWRASFSAVGLTNMDFAGGLHEMLNTGAGNLLASATNAWCIFRISDANGGKFECSVSDGATGVTQADSGITMVLDTIYTLRIELHGKNTPVGVAAGTKAIARFYIDGALVHTESGVNVPETADAANIGPIHFGTCDSTGPAADKKMSVCTTKLAWNAALSPDLPA